MRISRVSKLLGLPEQAAVTITYSLPSIAHNPEDRKGHEVLLSRLFLPHSDGEVTYDVEEGIVYILVDGQPSMMMAEKTFRRFRGE